MNKIYVNYGCGLSAPEDWMNFDASPTLRIQRMFLLRRLVRSKLKMSFPENVRYGDIVKGLPFARDSCDGVYCSHILEHLSLCDFRTALKNTYYILKAGGIFRCVVPDLEYAAREYLKGLEEGKDLASIDFLETKTRLGVEKRSRSLKDLLVKYLGNSSHLWMWDGFSLMSELKAVGFVRIRRCAYHDCEDHMFNHVEEEGRFINAVAIECRK